MAKTRRRAGDRRDGRLLRSLPAFSKFIPYIMPTRNDAHIFYDESFEVSTVDRTLRRLRVEGYKGIGMLHFLIAAYIRCISMLPGINRFIAGRRIYAHDDITVVMAVKRSLSVDATETTIKVHFQPTDTILDVYRKMNEKIEEIKTICHCGRKATMVARVDENGNMLKEGAQLVVGGNDMYVSLCRKHYMAGDLGPDFKK